MNLEGVTYRDWINERDPLPGDVAQVMQVFDENDGITYQLCCETALGYIWGASISASFIEYEVLR